MRAAFAKAPELTKAGIATAVNKSLVAYQGTAKQLAPVDSGYLRGSIQITPFTWTGNNGQGSIGTKVEYALPQETGSGIYGPKRSQITIKRTSGGKLQVFKSNGVKPHWYMKGSVEQNQAKTEENFQKALDSVTEAIAGGVGR